MFIVCRATFFLNHKVMIELLHYDFSEAAIEPIYIDILSMTYLSLTSRKEYKFTSLTFACLSVCYLLRWISIESFSAVVAVSSRRCMTASDTNSSRYATRKLKQLHVETALSSVTIAFTNCGRWKKMLQVNLSLDEKRKKFRLKLFQPFKNVFRSNNFT